VTDPLSENSLFDDLPLKVTNKITDMEKAEGKDLEGGEVYEELEALVGPETAKRLFDYYSGTSVYYPKRISIRLRHQQIRKDFKSGASYKELALRHGYSEQHIREITKERTK
jgi:Mor family transcriptional regulator